MYGGILFAFGLVVAVGFAVLAFLEFRRKRLIRAAFDMFIAIGIASMPINSLMHSDKVTLPSSPK